MFYLGIDPVLWDYYPPYASNRSLNGADGGNLCSEKAFFQDQLLFVGNGSSWGSFTPTSVHKKLLFRPYTDNSFTTLVDRSAEDEHLGILGPILRIEARDFVVVYVRGIPLGVPGAGPYGFQIDGLKLHGGRQEVKPGEITKFVFYAPGYTQSVGYVSSRLLLYRGVKGGISTGGVDGGIGTYEGLVGPLILYRPSSLGLDHKPSAVLTELVTILWIVNENQGEETGDQEESNLKHGINGRIFCSLEGLNLTLGRSARWYFASVGNEVRSSFIHNFSNICISILFLNSTCFSACGTLQLSPIGLLAF